MKRALYYVLLPILFALFIVVVATLIFFLLIDFNFPFWNFVVGEITIYKLLLQDTRKVFTHTYSLHTQILYLLVAIGIIWLFTLIGRLFRPLMFKAMFYVKQYKSILSLLFFFCFFLFSLEGVLLFSEGVFKIKGYSPGNRYKGANFSKEKPPMTKYEIADERGMTFYNYDSFPNKHYPLQFQINRQGFPSSFDFNRSTVDSLCSIGKVKKEKVLFLGDSFLEGQGVFQFSNCFTEIYRMRHPEQLICCTGIHGSDPIQYWLCAEKFIPELLPQEVCVFFCAWNDAVTIDRKPWRYIPHYTDLIGVGAIDNYSFFSLTGVGDSVLPPEKTYDLYRKQYSLFEDKNCLSTFCRKSCVTTQLYYTFSPISNNYKIQQTDSTSAYRNLQKIRKLAEASGASFSIIFIPTPEMKKFETSDFKQNFGWVFKDLWSYVKLPPKGLVKEEDCVSTDDFHFNEMGQLKFADFLEANFGKK